MGRGAESGAASVGVNLKPAAGRVNVSVQLRAPAQIQLSILRRDPSLTRDPTRAYPLAGLALTTRAGRPYSPLTITGRVVFERWITPVHAELDLLGGWRR